MQTSINPQTGQQIGTWPFMATEERDAVLAGAATTQAEWRNRSVAERSTSLRSLADSIDRHRDAAARIATEEMGKTLKQAYAEIDKCALGCRFYADHAAEMLLPRKVDTVAKRVEVIHQPLGVILGLMPWNYPFWQVFRSAVPILVAGNGYVLRHAENVSGCADLIATIFRDSDLPAGLFGLVRTSRENVETLIADRRIAGVTLTGSVSAGQIIGASAGKAVKPCVLELGGSDPFLVLADADLDRTVRGAVTGRTQNNGQSCISSKRFLVDRSIAEQFLDRFRDAMAKLTVGDPRDESTDIGPLARRDLRETLHGQVTRSVDAGATCFLGGTMPDGAGWHYPPTILTNVKPGMAAFDEELFGPVAAVTVVDDVDEAVELANRSRYGLGATIWSQDESRAWEAAAKIESGMVFINSITKSDPRVPFGGVKQSGVGREMALEGVLSFTNTKTVWLAG